MFYCGGDLPPNVKRNQQRQATTATGVLQDLAHLERIEAQGLKSDTDLHRTAAHQVKANLCNSAARRFDVDDRPPSQQSTHSDAVVVHRIQIDISGNKTIQNCHRRVAITPPFSKPVKRSPAICVSHVHVCTSCDE
jgi:hypothetical protein